MLAAGLPSFHGDLAAEVVGSGGYGAGMADSDSLTAARIDTVRTHMALECVGDWDGVIATFEHPRYEFAEGTDKIVCECPFYDQQAVVKALGLA